MEDIHRLLLVCLTLSLIQYTATQYQYPSNVIIDVSPQHGLEGPPGRQYAIKCRASWYGTPPDVDWTKDGVRIFDGNKYTIDTEQTPLEDMTISFLFINEARLGDSGRYGCAMKAPAFGLASTVFTIFQEPVLIPSRHQVIRRGANITLQCPARGNFGGNLFWMKDNIFIGGQPGVYDMNGDRISDYWVVDNQVMVILNADIHNAGVYTCQYRYFSQGRHRNVAQIIRVNFPVELNTAPLIQWSDLPNQGPLRLECKARGFPLPRIAWTYSNFTFEAGGYMGRNVSIVTSPQSATVVTSVLSLRKLPDKFNVARFECKARNEVSAASKLIMVVNMGGALQPGGRGAQSGPNTGTSVAGAKRNSAFASIPVFVAAFFVHLTNFGID